MTPVPASQENLQLLFWVTTLTIALTAGYALHRRRLPWAIPCLAVLGTVFTWYLVDILYTGIGHITDAFTQPVIDRALGQVILFVIAYGLMVGEVTRWFVRSLPESMAADPDLQVPFDTESAQAQIVRSLWFATACWLGLFGFAMVRNGYPILASLYPPVAGYRFPLWERDRLGESIDFVLSACKYTHLFVCAMFGVTLVLARRLGSRVWSALMIALTWPYWFFGRARNPILVIVVPAVAGYLIFSRHRLVVKLGIVLVLFLTVNLWFKLVLATRNEGVTQAFVELVSGDKETEDLKRQKHLGLDMFKELCYINTFIEEGSYTINWGKRYFAEAFNFNPRAIWKNKPLLGIDNAIARGARLEGGSSLVNVTISTGMIGQGVVNFGYILGPIAAAFLMSLWTGLLARLWVQRTSIMRACLFLVGLGLTFNAGRNITLLVFFPFVFGYALVLVFEAMETRKAALQSP